MLTMSPPFPGVTATPSTPERSVISGLICLGSTMISVMGPPHAILRDVARRLSPQRDGLSPGRAMSPHSSPALRSSHATHRACEIRDRRPRPVLVKFATSALDRKYG